VVFTAVIKGSSVLVRLVTETESIVCVVAFLKIWIQFSKDKTKIRMYHLISSNITYCYDFTEL